MYNFSAGPAKLPQWVLQRARDEFLDYAGSGSSIMELSHRGAAFETVARQSEQRLRQLLGAGEEWRILFLQGGASSQFALLPMNMPPHTRCAYVLSGHWSRRAQQEANRMLEAEIAFDAGADGYAGLEDSEQWSLSAAPAYVHITSNETIDGVQYPVDPVVRYPLAADMSSEFLSRSVALDRYDFIYAGAQKNAGPAGLTFVLIRARFLHKMRNDLPSMLNYRTLAQKASMLNTPPTFSWYISGLVLEWLQRQGGLQEIERLNRRKAEKLYRRIDASGYYTNSVLPAYRSMMNVVFRIHDSELERQFVQEADAAGLAGLKGHRSIGGLRASIYNAMPEQGIDALIEFLNEFERRHG